MDGLEQIVDMIQKRAGEKEKLILKEAEKEKKARLDVAKQKADAIRKELIEKAEQEAKAEKARHEANTKLKAKYRLLEAKENLLTSTLNTAYEKVKAKSKGKAYADILLRLAVEAGITLGEKDLELVLPKGQGNIITPAQVGAAISKETGQKTTVKVAKDTLRASGGAVMRITEGSKWVDNTFEARIERQEITVRDKASEILFSD
ncbi:MAG: V-type ATP synthase subunit E [Candidatus Thorarchaeota archaeon]|jgi:V/A-type H+-transporting ATPase subunit E